MIEARVAAVGVFLVSSLAAQQVPQRHVAIKVMDSTEKPVSEARIAIIDPQFSMKTNASGQATLNLAPGTYVLAVFASCGFEVLKEKIEVLDHPSNQSLTVVLREASVNECVEVIPDDPSIRMPTEPSILTPSIALEPVQTLPLIPHRVHQNHLLQRSSRLSIKPR